MAERWDRLSESDLERALAAVGTRIDFPDSSGLVTVVAQRVSTERLPHRVVSRRGPARVMLRPIVRPASASWWGRVAIAAAAVVVLASGVLVLSP
ncbi:MAG TPA: hypothetical protein VK132_12910, partial [Gemmatimonadales bacterium]|nr:hypothetical protein [Gemmatimonadales bacterium]